MAILAYCRVSAGDQSTEAQRHAIGARYQVEHWFEDAAVSGAVRALQRPGFGELHRFARKGDVVVVAAIDRLGRNTVDVLETVEALRAKGADVVSMREGFDLATPVGRCMLAMLSAVAELERENIRDRQLAGIRRAKAEGRALGAKKRIDDAAVAAWWQASGRSQRATAEHFKISLASVKRACRAARDIS